MSEVVAVSIWWDHAGPPSHRLLAAPDLDPWLTFPLEVPVAPEEVTEAGSVSCSMVPAPWTGQQGGAPLVSILHQALPDHCQSVTIHIHTQINGLLHNLCQPLASCQTVCPDLRMHTQGPSTITIVLSANGQFHKYQPRGAGDVTTPTCKGCGLETVTRSVGYRCMVWMGYNTFNGPFHLSLVSGHVTFNLSLWKHDLLHHWLVCMCVCICICVCASCLPSQHHTRCKINRDTV